MIGNAMAGKLGGIEQYMPKEGEASDDGTLLLGFLMKMKRKGVPMKFERIERAA